MIKVKEIISKLNNSDNPDYTLQIGEKVIKLESIQISEITFPVKKPDIRGGAYFSDTVGYKIKGITKELSLIPFFTKAMLGPNTEFKDLEIKTKVIKNTQKKDIVLLVNLTNSVQKNNQIELHMNIIGFKE